MNKDQDLPSIIEVCRCSHDRSNHKNEKGACIDNGCTCTMFKRKTVLSKFPGHVKLEIEKCIRCGESGFREHGDEVGYCSNCGLVYVTSNNTYHKPCEDDWHNDNVPIPEKQLLGTECHYCGKKINSLVRTTFADPEIDEGFCHAECKERQEGTLCNCGHLEVEHMSGDLEFDLEDMDKTLCNRDGCNKCQGYNAIGKPKAK